MTLAATTRDKIVSDFELFVVEQIQLVNDLNSYQQKGASIVKPTEVDERTVKKKRKLNWVKTHINAGNIEYRIKMNLINIQQVS